jgi:hypothetical protein
MRVKDLNLHNRPCCEHPSVQVNEFRSREHKVIPSKLSPRPEIEVKDGDIRSDNFEAFYEARKK